MFVSDSNPNTKRHLPIPYPFTLEFTVCFLAYLKVSLYLCIMNWLAIIPVKTPWRKKQLPSASQLCHHGWYSATRESWNQEQSHLRRANAPSSNETRYFETHRGHRTRSKHLHGSQRGASKVRIRSAQISLSLPPPPPKPTLISSSTYQLRSHAVPIHEVSALGVSRCGVDDLHRWVSRQRSPSVEDLGSANRGFEEVGELPDDVRFPAFVVGCSEHVGVSFEVVRVLWWGDVWEGRCCWVGVAFGGATRRSRLLKRFWAVISQVDEGQWGGVTRFTKWWSVRGGIFQMKLREYEWI